MILQEEPHITVGIQHGKSVDFRLCGIFTTPEGRLFPPGEYRVEISTGKRGFILGMEYYEDLRLVPLSSETLFDLPHVTIGIDFHWQRQECQTFCGILHLVCDRGEIYAINEVSVEDYLTSVISSEMSATSSLELLKAHAVVSRSWLLAQLPRFSGRRVRERGECGDVHSAGEIVRWYDRDDHLLFDVCADDHCQRYQGVTRVATPQVVEAVKVTRGEVLMYGGEVCDARFSKCCGGMSERFDACWGEEPHVYLRPVYDAPDDKSVMDLTVEQEAEHFIDSRPDVFCNTTDAEVLSQVLNSYDRETPDFFRWQVRYTRSHLSALVADRSGIDFGTITAIEPVERGASGRIIRLRIVGTRREMIVGKELYIRRILSSSHLYSSAFVVRRDGDDFVFDGAGGGHGVGLCQIGAAVMAHRGYDYRSILRHYYPVAELDIYYR